MKVGIILIGFLCVSTLVHADQNEMYADMAQEMLEANKYEKSIEKCAKVLEANKTHQQCLQITSKARSAIKAMENKSQALKLKRAADEKAATVKAANENAKQAAEVQKHEAVLKSNPCRASAVKWGYCEYMKVARVFELKIQREQKIGAQSGVVNMKSLHGAAEGKLNVETFAARKNAEYKKITGKSMTVADCQLTDTDTGDVNAAVRLRQDVVKLCELSEVERPEDVN